MTNPQLIENLLAGDKRTLAPHPCRGKPSWLPWGGAGAARAVADGTPAYGGSKYERGWKRARAVGSPRRVRVKSRCQPPNS